MGFVELSSGDVLVAASLILIVAAFTAWRLFYVDGRQTIDPSLSDGVVLILSDGMVRQASAGAEQMLGKCVDTPVSVLLDLFLDRDQHAAREAVRRLELTGEPVDVMVRGADGEYYELIGRPSGAMIRLVFREAGRVHDILETAEPPAAEADEPSQEERWAQETLDGLIAEAPIIAWHRTADGQVNWSGGEIRTRSGTVSAEQAVDLIVARTKLNRQPVLVGQPQKSRIEIVVNDGSETVSLQVIEIVRQDSSRIGIATDAGTAASAERTLTRFVQTMTETFAHLTVGLAIFDRNQTLALFNPALVQMWQVEPAWLARRPSLRDIIDELRATRRLPELQDFHKWRSRLVNLFENTEAADYEELWHLADGSNIRVLARPHPHGSLAFIFDDVTERMRLEQRYRHSIDLRRATLDGLNEGIAVFGANGLLQFVNQAFHEIWGTDSESVYAAMHARQLIGFCEDVTLEGDVWHRLHSFITGEESRRAWTTRLTMRSRRMLTARFAPLPDGSTLAVFSDITESERVATALDRRNEALDFVDACRDAIRDRTANLLRPALSQIAGQPDGADQELPAIAEDLLETVGEIEALACPPHAETVGDDHCVGVLRHCAAVLAHRARAAGMTLSVATSDELGEARLEIESLGQMAFQMTLAAFAHCRPGTALTLEYKASPDECALTLHAVGEDGALLSDDAQDTSVMLSPQVHALAARAGAMLEIVSDAPNDVRTTCWFPVRTIRLAASDPVDEHVAVGDGRGKIHTLNPKQAG